MKSEARLDSAIFQLTPTRTRCDLVIIANGRTEKIASGLVNPFLAHLKTAQDQIAKGGYSISLEPDPQLDAVWFTKGTVERFVRFVSTPEVLERVTTIESEILQIEEAIAIQGNDNFSVEDHQSKSNEHIEGSKSCSDADDEKAIVLYKPGTQPHPPESNGSTTQEENSKVQLLRVLETRKIVLRKEQAMAFARAAAAGFDMDNMAYLISFAECFGATRLMEACLQFMELWKKKHETGQWLEVEAVEAMSSRSEFASFNASGIVLSGDTMKQNMEAWPVSTGDATTESNGKADQKIPSDSQPPLGPHEYFQGQYNQPAYPPWAMHPPPGGPVFQPYPMQGMPYYQNYPGGGPYFHPPYPPMDHPRFNTPERMGKRHSMESKDNNADSEIWETGIPSTRSQDGTDHSTSEFEIESSHGRESHKRVSRSGKKKSGVVVIRNINYITSKKHGSSGSESSASEIDSEEDNVELHSNSREKKHMKSSSSSKKKEGHKRTVESSDEYIKDGMVYGKEEDSGNWQAFQSFLMRAEEKTKDNDGDIFSGEKEPPPRRKENRSEADPILPPERDSGNAQERRIEGFDSFNGSSRVKHISSNDELLMSGEGRGLIDSQIKEIEGGGGGGRYRRAGSDDFMIYAHEKQINIRSSLDPIADNEYQQSTNLDKNSYDIRDESFMIPLRSSSQSQLEPESRTAIDIESEFPAVIQRTEDSSLKARNQLSYEPDELTMMPERVLESDIIDYDPAIDYDFQITAEISSKLEATSLEDVTTSIKEEVKKSDNDKKLRASQDGLEKRKKDALARKITSSRMNPHTEAQKRAEKLRAYKADLQKVKKEQEEEQIRRLEALKRERQKRIAARSSSNSTSSPSTLQQTKTKLAPKSSPSPYKGSKFSDSEPGSSSPLKRLSGRTTSMGSSDSQRAAATSRLNGNAHRLSQSVSSLVERKKDSTGVTPEPKTDSVQTKRLSDPKVNNSDRSSRKPVTADQLRRRSMPDESQTKKISAIMQLDKSKSAALPELKIKSPKAPDVVQNKSATVQKGLGSKASTASESKQVKKANDKAPRISNSDDNMVIEKTVVMLENEVVPTSSETTDVESRSYRDDRQEKTGLDSEYTTIRAPPSPLFVGEVENSTNYNPDDQLNSYEVVIDYAKDEPRKLIPTPMEEAYQAPYARATSLEDSTTRNSALLEPLPVFDSRTAMQTESVRAQVSTPDLHSVTQETYEKPHSKESKGFRKLLKFGRKSHTSASGEGNLDSDASSVDDSPAAVISSNDVGMLKNLISQDDTHTGGTPTKVSRPFSLLSPFRSKNSEKKVAS
ncbi:COP1-interacting protein 7-like [Typha angustifolia]|uniref:COP1-interacting protein 7-like n=1 Tax=Typha angustifolia TaxID=59011 RepID=UPI003C302C1A